MKTPVHYRGVNLGNWLVLERWMKPALFEGTSANDEYTLCDTLGRTAAEKLLRRHRETFITEADFAWLRDRGINSVRLPIGYWLFEPDGPFVPGTEMVDYALDLCERYGLSVNLDWHGLPGSQGPEHHTGRQKYFRWDKEQRFMDRSLDLIETVAQRYRDRDCVSAVTLVNEPDMNLPREFLLTFFENGYERVRRHMSAENVAVIITAFTEGRMGEFHRKLTGKQNVLTDIHPYPCFVPWEPDQLNDFIAWGPAKEWPFLVESGIDDLVVGEWSLGLAPSLRPALEAMPAWRRELAMKTFAANQLITFDSTAGWFFWSYKIESLKPELQCHWSFRDAVHRGWLPDQFAEPAPRSAVEVTVTLPARTRPTLVAN